MCLQGLFVSTTSIYWWSVSVHTLYLAWWVRWHPVLLGASGHVITWWPMFKHSFSLKAQQQDMSCFSEGSSCPQGWQSFALKAYGPALGFTHRGLPRLQTASLSDSDASSTIASTGSNGRASCITAWTCCKVFFYSGPHSKWAAFWVTQ